MVIIAPSPGLSFRADLFTSDEINSMQTVLEKFKTLKTKQLVDLSHQEPAWKENIEGKKMINYKFAFELLAI